MVNFKKHPDYPMGLIQFWHADYSSSIEGDHHVMDTGWGIRWEVPSDKTEGHNEMMWWDIEDAPWDSGMCALADKLQYSKY